jgi:hypothetical protein
MKEDKVMDIAAPAMMEESMPKEGDEMMARPGSMMDSAPAVAVSA